MSQEEEKLIEEFWKEQSKNDNPLCEKDVYFDCDYKISSFYFDDIWEGGKEEINQAICKAYRAGKLAGFENVISILPKKECQQDPNCTCSSRIMNLINFLIEEEKKKL